MRVIRSTLIRGLIREDVMEWIIRDMEWIIRDIVWLAVVFNMYMYIETIRALVAQRRKHE